MNELENEDLVRRLVLEAGRVSLARSGMVYDPFGLDATYLFELWQEVNKRLEKKLENCNLVCIEETRT